MRLLSLLVLILGGIGFAAPGWSGWSLDGGETGSTPVIVAAEPDEAAQEVVELGTRVLLASARPLDDRLEVELLLVDGGSRSVAACWHGLLSRENFVLELTVALRELLPPPGLPADEEAALINRLLTGEG